MSTNVPRHINQTTDMLSTQHRIGTFALVLSVCVVSANLQGCFQSHDVSKPSEKVEKVPRSPRFVERLKASGSAKAKSKGPRTPLQTFYERYSRKTGSAMVHHVRDQVLHEMNIQPGMKIAEVAAHGGYYTGFLILKVGPSGTVTATVWEDSSLTNLQGMAEQSKHGALHPVRSAHGTSGLENVAKASLSLVLMGNGVYFEHRSKSEDAAGWTRQRDLMREVFAALKPGGALVYYQDFTNLSFLRGKGLEHLFSQAGYSGSCRHVALSQRDAIDQIIRDIPRLRIQLRAGYILVCPMPSP